MCHNSLYLLAKSDLKFEVESELKPALVLPDRISLPCF
jgi:hypothetical protein